MLLDSHRVPKIRMRGRQFLCASFLFFVCLAYYMMAYGQTTTAVMVMSTVDELFDYEIDNNVSTCPYVIDKPNLCSDVNQTISALIMVVTAPNNSDARESIRRTWGNIRQRPDIRLVFVLGYGADNDTQNRLLGEDSTFGDLIQGRFLDAYYNLTRKSVLILKWAHSRCPNARHVVKIDDDCFLNAPNLLKFLADRKETSAIYGRMWNKVKPIRDEKHKWSVSKKVFSGNEFPSYTGGPSYVFTSGTAIQALLQAINSGQVPWLELEDVYVTGLCAEKAKVKRINDNKFNVEDFPNVCGASDVITYHRVSPDFMYLLWWVTNDRKWKPECASKNKHKPLVEMVNLISTNLHSN